MEFSLAGPDDLSTLVLVEWEHRETGGGCAEGQETALIQGRQPAEHVYIKSEAVLRVCTYLRTFTRGRRGDKVEGGQGRGERRWEGCWLSHVCCLPYEYLSLPTLLNPKP